MRITNAAKTGLIGLVTTGAALAMTAAVPSAQAATHPARAATTATAPTAPRATWVTLYHGSKRTTNWKTPGRKSKSKVLQIVARCWSGGDGTKMRMIIQRKYNLIWRDIHQSRIRPCNGSAYRTRISNAKAGQTYRARIQLDRKHTVEVWLQNYA